MNLKFLVLIPGFFLCLESTALAKSKRSPQSKKARAYSFYDDGGQSHQAGCDPEKKPQARLKKKKELSKFSGYMGSESLDSVLQPDVDAWKHYFNSQSACEVSLKKSASFKKVNSATQAGAVSGASGIDSSDESTDSDNE